MEVVENGAYKWRNELARKKRKERSTPFERESIDQQHPTCSTFTHDISPDISSKGTPLVSFAIRRKKKRKKMRKNEIVEIILIDYST